LQTQSTSDNLLEPPGKKKKKKKKKEPWKPRTKDQANNHRYSTGSLALPTGEQVTEAVHR
jgi:hypothetical protein